jgi:hypothetical protein
MWTITILFGGGGNVNLVYDDSQKALKLHEQLKADRNPSDENYPPQVVCKDEYGTEAVIDIAEVICHTLQHVEKAQAGYGELQIINAKASAAMQGKMQRDPALRLMQPGGLRA